MIMNSKSKGFLARVLMFALLAFLALPTAAIAQNRTYQNGRWDRNEEQRREELRRREAERRRNRNDDRWDNNRNRNQRNRADDGYGNYGGSFNLRQTALNAGFADGAKEGRKDRDRGERFDFRDESGFQKATRDYSSRLGDRGLYQTYYRQAFENGYRDGYAGY
jgi:hypothetical protein